MAKYLPEFGWQPIILTVPLGEDPDSRFGPPNDFRRKNRVIETYGYTSGKALGLGARKHLERAKPLLRFLYRRYSEIVHYPDKEKGWTPFAVNAGEKLLKNEEVDAMISSYSPATCHLIARELKEKHKIPWVADFRDLWTQNHNYPYTPIRKVFERRLELKTLSTADALVTTSTFWAEKLKMMHKKETYTITNGFDPDKMTKRHVDLTSKFTITYTGQIYIKGQDTSKFLAVLKDLISEGAIKAGDVDVRFYGPELELLTKQIEKFGLLDVVNQCGIVSREVSFEKQMESQVLLLLKWEDKKERGAIGGKLFEYLAARRPILATGGHSDAVTQILEKTNAGTDAQNVDDIKNALRKLYAEYKLTGKTSCHGKMKEINKYSYKEMARKFAVILDDLPRREI